MADGWQWLGHYQSGQKFVIFVGRFNERKTVYFEKFKNFFVKYTNINKHWNYQNGRNGQFVIFVGHFNRRKTVYF